MHDIPLITNYSIEQISAWASFHVVVATFVITIIAAIVTSIMLYLSTRQYAQLKNAEAILKGQEVMQSRFNNAQHLFRVLSTHEGGGYTELAALISLRDYPEYINVYRFILYNLKSMNPDEKDKAIVDACIKEAEYLVKLPEKN